MPEVGRAKPRWSMLGLSEAVAAPPPMAGLPGSGSMVWVEPPNQPSGASCGLTITLGVLMRLPPLGRTQPSQSSPAQLVDVLPATMLLFSVHAPAGV